MSATHAPSCSSRGGQAQTLRLEGDDRVDDHRDVERGSPLPRSGARVPPSVTPQIDYQVAEAVDDARVLLEIRCRLDVADDPQPLRHTIELAECLLQRGEDRER